MQVEKEEETNIQIEEKLPGILKNETKKKFSLMEEGGGLTELGHEKQPWEWGHQMMQICFENLKLFKE